MRNEDTLDRVISEACELLRQSARGKGRTIAVSPEVADMLERIEKRTEPAVERAVAAASPVVREDSAASPSRCVIPAGIQTLESLEAFVAACHSCPLAETRTNIVFGTGDPHSRLVFVGEAPGQEEDRQGKPFVGRAGQLLTDIIEKGMGLQRPEVYICNVLKCRPPGNRNPLPNEVEACEPFLIRQLEIIRPKVICALGAYAAQTLLKTTETIGRLRGKWHFYHGIPLRATYHPAYLLRNPSDKRKTWEDVLEVMKVYNGEVTPTP